MSLRLMQVTVPDDMTGRAEELLEGAVHLGTGDDAKPGGVACLNILIEAKAEEASPRRGRISREELYAEAPRASN